MREEQHMQKFGIRIVEVISVILVILVVINQRVLAANTDSLKTEITKAINDGARYSANVLLDQDGKSRCDYNWITGKWYAYETPWHTGQIIFGLVEAYRITGNKEYLDAAKRAGDWWCSLLITDHPKLKGMVNAIHGDGIENIVFATVTDGTNGMYELWRTTGIDKYAAVPKQAGDWMLRNMYVPESKIFYDNVDPVTGDVMKESSPFWPNKKKQQLYDIARPNNEGYLYKDMYDYTKDEKYRKVFLDICESLIEKQGPEGVWMDFMPNDKSEGSFHPRFSLWYAESLMQGYRLTHDKRYLEAAKKTANVFAACQMKDGTIYYTNYVNGKKNQNSICGSASAFAGILWLQLLEEGAGTEYKANIERSVHFILANRFPATHPDKNLAGGFFETRARTKDGHLWFTAREDIATSFGLRFLSEYYRYNFGR
jgi:rhamnogalacturonyl hydrolase YesR